VDADDLLAAPGDGPVKVPHLAPSPAQDLRTGRAGVDVGGQDVGVVLDQGPIAPTAVPAAAQTAESLLPDRAVSLAGTDECVGNLVADRVERTLVGAARQEDAGEADGAGLVVAGSGPPSGGAKGDLPVSQTVGGQEVTSLLAGLGFGHDTGLCRWHAGSLIPVARTYKPSPESSGYDSSTAFR
jgi:hypothetical protein